ncbi:bifunctional cobalt-precorrin-7 (C(5))-methyltransferase CbiE/decarboxylating cobalt-precorrin-6B (C(15))-methyltransferase CbiT [Sinorhizobium fredii]|uniref:Bifunctional cobalt-precorrin-7 (C(5))-methyltransferase CbiE/decarboxylating cobalt-precorrin-6B (C(15))-methyltransferase CbiT n=2 Tax=Rhizobium fredii TaxID=380 RepID=A0A2A6LZN1_RHIFR|nr:Cobalt-precorrin-6y C5-methyltransferase [Sinorhizobium fredii CCBAU 25509]MQW96927.1 precorrin-6y C5,15-methyltransferase (decarboxylating) subunit CbiE [Sinorhizobium fredii]MQX09935.1 precorrin-6y C5,15-methyltransferase (decarboxylating) subunit CbiE [Sinorhizobium fredii]PDT47750.1 bifunctional cobalt-precorrin-7 (C(5))-methyltransferase CbiE/decarboxylating cobalt-precorrin-6B (C(15))-methyltransferase CbiT [Sinorhizobium fredii]UTY50700.1 precorrin-6y C5,15-methyltransferase (decarbox
MRGLSMADMSNSVSAIVAPWLTVIGIGEDGVAGLGDEAKRLIAAAPVVFGGIRHIELAASLIRGEREAWQSPFEKSVEAIISRRGSPVVVLASGDPFLYGVGATLARRIEASEMRTIPAPSAFSLAAARLGWALQEAATVSLHGRPLDLIRPHLQPGARVLALTSDGNGPNALAGLLSESGFGQSRLTVLEALGGERERVSRHVASSFTLEKVNALNVCAIEVVADAGSRVLPLASGRDDALFEHDGQITKREVRALTLSALAPRKGELLWDIGAGSGSIAIEWMLADPAMRAIAVEASPERAARIGRNAARFGVPGLSVVEGQAPDALSGLARPDVIFIGGGGSEAGVMEAAIAALPSGGRLVANAVTTKMEAVLLAHHAGLGGSLIRIDIARASPVGTMTGWRPAMPVTQWSWVKA